MKEFMNEVRYGNDTSLDPKTKKRNEEIDCQMEESFFEG